MAKRTKADKLIQWILANGGVEVPSRNVYRAFLRKDGKYYLVGKMGALRVNKTPTVQDSISLTDSPSYKRIMESLNGR